MVQALCVNVVLPLKSKCNRHLQVAQSSLNNVSIEFLGILVRHSHFTLGRTFSLPISVRFTYFKPLPNIARILSMAMPYSCRYISCRPKHHWQQHHGINVFVGNIIIRLC